MAEENNLAVWGATPAQNTHVYNVTMAPYHAVADGTTNAAPAVQAAVTAALATGGEVLFPHGKYRFTVTNPAPSTYGVLVDYSALQGFAFLTPLAVSLKGQGAMNTVLSTTGTDNFSMALTGSTVSPSFPHVFAELSNLCFSSDHTGNGLYAFQLAFYSYNNLLFELCRVGLTLESCLSSELRNVSFWGCDTAVSAAQGAGGSSPNALLFDKCEFGSNSLLAVGMGPNCTNISFVGCNFENNGTMGNSASGGVSLAFTGGEGNVGANFDGCYFEGNAGGWDVQLLNTSAQYITHTFKGCNFNRVGNVRYCTNNVQSIGKNIVIFEGCTFAGFGGYVPSGGRIYVNGDANTRFIFIGCYFGSAVESHNIDLGQGVQVIGADSGVTATNCLVPFKAVDVAKNQYFSVEPRNSGWITLGQKGVTQTPGLGFYSDSRTPDGTYDTLIYASGGNAGASQGDINIAAELTRLKGIVPFVDSDGVAGYDIGKLTFRFRNVYATNGTIQTSDARLKTKPQPVDAVLCEKLVRGIQPVTYKWLAGGDKVHYGVIAQDLEKVLKAVGIDPDTFSALVKGEDAYGVRYEELLMLLWPMVQGLLSRVEQLEKTKTE